VAEEGSKQRNAFDRLMQRFAASKPSSWLALNVANPIDKRLLPLTKGRISIGQITSRAPVGLLIHIGAKSGQKRQTPLNYMADGERIVLIASQTGRPKHPAWFHNLRAHPDRVRFMAKGTDREYVAREADGAERARLWTEFTEIYPGYDTYQQRTERRIPVVVLEPKD
jgi:deazaflavin-dependent oxidoreductase (nitroreductase family)